MPVWIALLAVVLMVQGCAALRPTPRTMAERLDVFPRNGLPLERPVTIRWNRFHVPFVEAETDRDLALAMGMVHAHLRLAEIRVLKQLVQGRMSEMVGPAARNIDHALRIMDIGRAAPEMVRQLPESERMLLESFAAGLNLYQSHLSELPPEFSLLGLSPERLLETYEQAGTHPSQPTLIPKGREDLVPPRPPPRWPWVLGGMAGALLIAALAAFVVERWSGNAGSQAPATASVAPAPATEEPTAPAADTTGPAVSTPAIEPQVGAGQVSLRLAFAEDTWVEVYDGSGAAVLYDLGSRGTERTVQATAPISVTIGDPNSVAVYVNGKRLKVPAAPAGQSLTRFSIDAAGVVR